MTPEEMAKFNAGQFAALIPQLSARVARHPNDHQASLDLGLALSHSGRHDIALSVYRGLLDRNPDDDIVLVNTGFVQLRLGQYADAIESLTRVLHIGKRRQVDPSVLSLAHTNIGVIREEQADFDQAVHHYKVAMALYGENALAVKYLAELRENGEMDRGIFRNLIREDGSTSLNLWYYHDYATDLVNQEVLIQAGLASVGEKTPVGDIISAVSIPWFAIIRELEHDPAFLFRVPWRALE